MNAEEFRQIRNGVKVITYFRKGYRVFEVVKKSHPKASRRKLLLLFPSLDGGTNRVWRSSAVCRLADDHLPEGPIESI